MEKQENVLLNMIDRSTILARYEDGSVMMFRSAKTVSTIMQSLNDLINDLESKLKYHGTQITGWSQAYDKLKEEFDEYKRTHKARTNKK